MNGLLNKFETVKETWGRIDTRIKCSCGYQIYSIGIKYISHADGEREKLPQYTVDGIQQVLLGTEYQDCPNCSYPWWINTNTIIEKYKV